MANIIEDLKKEIPIGTFPLRRRFFAKQPKFHSRIAEELLPPNETKQIFIEISEIIQTGARPVTYVAYITQDVFQDAKNSFSKLINISSPISLKIDELIDEIFMIIDMKCKSDVSKGPYIYSMEILEPEDIFKRIDLSKFDVKFPDIILNQIKNGYISYDILYSIDKKDLSVILKEIFREALNIEISLKPSSEEFTIHQIVNIV